MTDRPIPFSAPMIRALLDGRKTQTRRILKPQPVACDHSLFPNTPAPTIKIRNGFAYCTTCGAGIEADREYRGIRVPYAPGDRLWVREEYYQFGHWEEAAGATTKGGKQKWQFVAHDDVVLFDPPAAYRKGRQHKDPATRAWHKRLGRFMPRRYSRLTLIVTGVKVERLQDISEEDAQAEGASYGYSYPGTSPDDERLTQRRMFHLLWNSINGADAWDKNPWVVALTFTVHRCNIDDMDDGCSKNDLECLSNNGDCHDDCLDPERGAA